MATAKVTTHYVMIIQLITRLIDRLKKRKRLRFLLAMLFLIIGLGIIGFTIKGPFPISELGNAGASALITLGTLFYSTIFYGLFKEILERGDKIALAEEIKSELEGFTESQPTKQNEKFESRFFDILKTVF